MITKLVVDRVRDFVAGLDLSSKVLSFSPSGSNTIITVENVFHIRATPSPNQRQVDIDGTKYNVLSVDYDTNTVVVEGALVNPDPQLYKVDNPFYWHGTPIATANHIKNLNDSSKVPMVYLRELLKERCMPPSSNLETIVPDMRLYLGDVANFNDWTREEHYSEAIRPLMNLSEVIKEELYKGRCVHVAEGEEIQRAAIPKWGIYQDSKGNIRKMFNENLDVVEMTFNLRIYKCNNH